MMAIAQPKAANITVPSLLARLADKNRQGRNPCTWEQIREILGTEFALLNYAQFLYALLLAQRAVEPKYIRMTIGELEDCRQNAKHKVQQQGGSSPKMENTSLTTAGFRPQRKPK
jgi:hypothetical protein